MFELASFFNSPAVFIICGAKTAPKHRFVTAIVLSVLWAITVTALFTWSATASGYDDWFKTGKSLLWAILGVVSVLLTSFYIHRSEQDDRHIESLLSESKRKREESSSSAASNEPRKTERL